MTDRPQREAWSKETQAWLDGKGDLPPALARRFLWSLVMLTDTEDERDALRAHVERLRRGLRVEVERVRILQKQAEHDGGADWGSHMGALAIRLEGLAQEAKS